MKRNNLKMLDPRISYSCFSLTHYIFQAEDIKESQPGDRCVNEITGNIKNCASFRPSNTAQSAGRIDQVLKINHNDPSYCLYAG